MKKHKHKKSPIRTILIIVGSLLAFLLLVVATIFFWPLGNNKLQTSNPSPMNYSQALSKVDSIKKLEPSVDVKEECSSVIMEHGAKTDKAVVMFHGVTVCPSQFKDLAEVFYDSGYNVYIPRAPHHGTSNRSDHAKVRSQDLTQYVDQSIDIATGLGEEIGVIGLSGGGMLSTWATHYRSDINRALILSPFYEPAAHHAPKWQLQFLNVLYGNHILPDQFNDAFSYRALANYNIVTKNLKKNPSGLKNLKSLAVVTTPNDDDIDLNLAFAIPDKIAKSNNITYHKVSLPKDWGVEHDIVAASDKHVAPRQAELYRLYFNLYEGRGSKL